MKKLYLPFLVLIAFYAFAGTLLDIPSSLPEGTVVPDEVREILTSERIEQAILYSNFRYGWYFFENLLSLTFLKGFSILLVKKDSLFCWEQIIVTFADRLFRWDAK